MRQISILALVFTLTILGPAPGQASDEFNVSKIFLTMIEQSTALKPKPDQTTALNQLRSRPFSPSSTPDMSDPKQKYRYFNALGYYAALGEEHPDWAVQWLDAFSALTPLGRQGLVTAINNIGPPSENMASAILIENIPALKGSLERLPRNLLTFPAITQDILGALNGAFYATGRPTYTALIIKGFKESLPNGRKPDPILSHLIPYFLQMQSMLDAEALYTIKYTASLPEMAEIAPLLNAILDRSLIKPDSGNNALSTPENLDYFFDGMSKIVGQIALNSVSN